MLAFVDIKLIVNKPAITQETELYQYYKVGPSLLMNNNNVIVFLHSRLFVKWLLIRVFELRICK